MKGPGISSAAIVLPLLNISSHLSGKKKTNLNRSWHALDVQHEGTTHTYSHFNSSIWYSVENNEIVFHNNFQFNISKRSTKTNHSCLVVSYHYCSWIGEEGEMLHNYTAK